MSFQKVGAGQGVEWLKGAIELVKANPTVFLVNSLIYCIILGVLGIIPIIGSIAIALLMPVLAAGMMYAYREQHEGRTPTIEQLFQGFKEPGRIGPLLILGLPAIVAAVVMVVLMFVMLGGAMLGGAMSGSGTAAAASIGGSVALVALLGLAVFLAAALLVIFAIPRVMFDGIEPFAALKESLSASLANFLPLLVLGLVLFVIYFVAALVMIIPILGLLVFFVVALAMVAVSNAALYLAYREIFAGSATEPPAPPM